MFNIEYNKKVTGSDINNNTIENISSRPASFQKIKFRKDAKGNLILKKKLNIKKTKHHINFIDTINSKKELATIIDIESYKKYNLDNYENLEDIEENEENKNIKGDSKDLVGEANIVRTNGCCVII